MKTLLLALMLLAVAFVIMGVKVFFVRGGKFPSGHISHSEALRKKGIGCAAHSENQTRRRHE
ncbi:MAG: hypothetical protein NC111_01610 [Bacteroides sp.]|nr:hypothetical protein [Bacteroides sp.]MCM1414253.1 hypothetical protein [Bacteroides sp.]MCM1471212.1 hypothetical protein [Bacteroides sp.]